MLAQDDPINPSSAPTMGKVFSFEEVNRRLWHLPTKESGEADWDASRHTLGESPEEAGSLISRYCLRWLNPYISLAAREKLEESFLPPPQRSHRAVYSGARLSHAFREEETRKGRDAWTERTEVAELGEDAAVHVKAANPLSKVQFRKESNARGRLRWVGYLRSCDAPHVLLGGVEWGSESNLPAYRRDFSQETGEAVHDGFVHGERLFYQVTEDGMRCTCEYLSDLVPLSEDGSVHAAADGSSPPRAPSLLLALLRTFRSDVLAILCPATVALACELATPWLLQQFVLFLESNKTEAGMTRGLVMFGLFCAASLIKPLALNKRNQRGRRVSSLFRTSALSLLFEKCFTISPDAVARPEMNPGRVLTMASSDIENIRDFPRVGVFLYVAPIQLTLYLVYLCTLVGWSVLAGLAVYVSLLPLQGAITKALKRRQESLSACTDVRLKHTNELLAGIRVVKMMGWESKFLSAIEDDARANELRHRRAMQWWDTALGASVLSAPPFMVAAMLTAYVLTGHVLEASVVLPVVVVVGAITYPIIMLPEAFTSLAKFIVSTDRLSQFLECDDSHITVEHSGAVLEHDGGNAGACFVDATVLASVPSALPMYAPRRRGFRRALDRVREVLLHRHVPVELQWERVVGGSGAAAVSSPAPSEPQTPESNAENENGRKLFTMKDRALLRDVCVSLPRGKLTVIVGATGSGKTVLLSTLLGAFRFRGRVGVLPSIAYVPQQPWIMQETVEANITFFEGNQRGAQHSLSLGDASGGAAVNTACSPLRPTTRDALAAVPTLHPRLGGVNTRLTQAVRCCQLEADLPLLPKGLATEIGEKGVNLSGGQKARVSLARAVYADCDVYVLDDPLSALDAHVGRRVMQDVIMEALQGKTRVLVTHQLHVLPQADQVVVVRDGSVVFSGPYSAYAASPWKTYVENEEEKKAALRQQQAAELIDDAVNGCSPAGSPVAVQEGEDIPVRRDSDSDEVCSEATSALNTSATHVRNGGGSSLSHLQSRQTTEVEVSRADTNARDCGTFPPVGSGDSAAEDGALMTVEEKEIGHVPWLIYGRYFEAGGGMGLVVRILCSWLVGDSLHAFNNVWLTLWSVHFFGDRLNTIQQLSIYLCLVVAVQVIIPGTDLYFFTFCRRAARRFHAALLYTVSSGTLTFFERTPLGRIINRFSKDIYTLDDELPMCIMPLTGIANSAIMTLVVMMVTSPPTIIVVLVAAFFFARLLKLYATVVREVRRRGSVVQSPLFSLLEEVVQGRATIAAYEKSHVLFAEALRRLDLVYSCTYIEKAVTLWLSLRIEFAAALVVIMVGLIGVIEKTLDNAPTMAQTRVGLISLSLTISLNLSWAISETVEQAAVMEASMNSVQRICHYIDTVPQENLLLRPSDPYVAMELASHAGACVPCAGGARGGKRATDVVVDGAGSVTTYQASPKDSERGALRLEHVDMRYRPGLPLVLRDVSFSIAPGQKVGVVGRTGSGKSTLLQVFLRLVEVCGGRMLVCGRDAQSYTLPALRRLFSMIPQDPVLFDGTIRSNVDPFGDATDAEVRRALASVGFVDTPMPGSSEALPLETVVQEGGSNFSVGQRQLLCLARALLKKGSAFILMDEATANVDARLDQSVQRVVAEQFRGYTVVTIAHRLHTIASYDVILVMANGRLVEMGSPRSLLENRASTFYGMVAQGAAVQAADGTRGEASKPKRVEEVVANFLKDCK